MKKKQICLLITGYYKRRIWAELFESLRSNLVSRQLSVDLLDYRRRRIHASNVVDSIRNISFISFLRFMLNALKLPSMTVSYLRAFEIPYRQFFPVLFKSLLLALYYSSYGVRIVVFVRAYRQPEIIVAANVLNITSYGIQHGDYYFDGYKKKNPNEGMCSKVFLWDSESSLFFKKRFPKGPTVIISGPAWAVALEKMRESACEVDIGVFLSAGDSIEEAVAWMIRDDFRYLSVLIQPHPTSGERQTIWHQMTPVPVQSSEVFLPKVGIVFNSTIIQELNFLGVVCFFITGDCDPVVRKHPDTFFFRVPDCSELKYEIRNILDSTAAQVTAVAKQASELQLGPTSGVLERMADEIEAEIFRLEVNSSSLR